MSALATHQHLVVPGAGSEAIMIICQFRVITPHFHWQIAARSLACKEMDLPASGQSIDPPG